MAEIKKQEKTTTKKKKHHPLRFFCGFLALAVSGALIYSSMQEVFTTIQLKQSIHASEQELAQIKEETKDLKTEKKNLEDPDYVLRYARGKFMVTKKTDGEQVFKLPSKDE